MSTQPLMKHEVVLPVIVDGYHWACNQDRMWNLNELHKELELPSAKEPGQWRSSVRTLLDQDANLHVAHGGSTPGGHGLLKRRLLPMRCGSHLISTLRSSVLSSLYVTTKCHRRH